ncbi:MAG TPA: tRNA pseudouridine(38-40) synthase TruA [Actinomycetota bacterium]
MAVLKLVVAYDGTDFRGWARQPRLRTVQGALEDALARLLGAAPKLSVAGRTDAGVHAWGQVVSFEADADPERVARALNGILAPEVVIRSARIAPEGFDARRSATAREYRYRIGTGESPSPFTARYEWHLPGALALRPMRAAARDLLGEHDFASFCRRPQGDRSTVRRMERLAIARHGERLEVGVRGNAFLHQMVRSLVGTLVRVGEGRMDPGEIPGVLRARDRAAAGPVAPARGLVLERVVYGVPRVARGRER